MRSIILLLTVFISFSCFSLDQNDSEKIKVKKVVDQFFESLNQQDTLLNKIILLLKDQVWWINDIKKSTGLLMKFFRDDIGIFDPEEIWQEIPLSDDIKIHNGIAMVWVPSEFKINGIFTHCCIDIFTLTDTNEGWKNINASYTKQLNRCNDQKKMMPNVQQCISLLETTHQW